MKRIKTKPKRNFDYLILVAIVALAIGLRVYGQIDKVFIDGQIIFREVDPYLHMRLAENIAANYPHILRWDMYAQYPNGAPTYPPVLAFIVATIAWIGGLGNPSMHLVDIVGVWVPPALAGVVVVLVYFLGKTVFKSGFVGLVGGLIVAVTPTELFHRSMLGFTDHHILEVVLALSSILFITLALQRKSWRFGVLAVISLTLFALNWVGWPQLFAIIGMWAYFYFGYKLLKSKALFLLIPLGVILVITLLVQPMKELLLAFLSHSFLGYTGTIREVMPVTLKDYWYLYGLSGILMAFGMFLAIKNKLHSLFLVWAIFFIIASIAEKRWGYYGIVGMALFSAYFIWWIGDRIQAGRASLARRFKLPKSLNLDWKPYILGYACLLVVAVTLPYGYNLAHKGTDISADWYNACKWLEYNTPEPFGNNHYYYPVVSEKANYGVLSWWDYGHWIIQIGQRVPVSSPTQQESPQYYPFFYAKTDEEANKVLEGSGIDYVIIDRDMAGRKFHAIQSKVIGNNRDWEDNLEQSMVYRMFTGKVDGWELIANFNTVRIFRRTN